MRYIQLPSTLLLVGAACASTKGGNNDVQQEGEH
jgi:hypothetical protein